MEPVSFHFIVTLSWGSNPVHTSTYANTANVPPGKPRSEIFAQLVAIAKEQLAAPGGAVILFFSLEPEDMTASLHTVR